MTNPATDPSTDHLTQLGSHSTPYPSSPDEAVLETFANPHADRDYWIEFNCPEFTALCPITAQPDFGTLTIRYVPDQRCVESKSLKLYLFSFRNQGAFAERIANRILDDIVAACAPRRAEVTGQFTPRGGISITVTATWPK